ncbi:Uncharacterized protein TCM_015027 [Theobroma cacao]|uniref:Uncharacterized protein n=1 Tax=Theobroma cacao TaxID=3641 RepID=A0A061G7J5_THECC|nr:Uncharacterized protein TCM_015027 [Theobroma cacao]
MKLAFLFIWEERVEGTQPLKGEGQESSFILGFTSNTPQRNSLKVWKFDPAHQRWLPVADMAASSRVGFAW